MNAHGPYEIVRQITKSNMARVFLARDGRDGSRVALKVLDASMDAARFEREAHMLASMEHASIVRYVAHGTTDGKPWIATEWLEGEDLGARLDRGALDLPQILAMARGTAGALAYLHARGIVHRDVKPGNVFLTGETAQVRLLDFGLVRHHELPNMTAAHVIMGTPQYMPPEQALDARGADARADVFSLAAVIFHCVTGRPIYVGSNIQQLLSAIVLARVPRMSTLAAFVPRELDDLVARATSRDPANRPRNAIAFLAELARVPEASYCEGESVTRIRAAAPALMNVS